MQGEQLRGASLGELEALWLRPVELSLPRGRYRGRVLHRLDNATARSKRWRWSQRAGFEWLPFGIDFDRRLWTFGSREWGIGRFDVRLGPSRWRDTEAIGLRYGPSRLPTAVRELLYDEVKPLDDRWMLGIGGMNAGPGVGDHFFFSLERIGARPRDRSR